jgi:Zn-dependent alcohol dehydrogenase
VEVTDIVIPDPGPGEVVVKIIACGVCHTDIEDAFHRMHAGEVLRSVVIL